MEAAASRSACATISGDRCLRSCGAEGVWRGWSEVGAQPCMPSYANPGERRSHETGAIQSQPARYHTWKIWLYSTTASVCFSASFSPSTATWEGRSGEAGGGEDRREGGFTT